MNLQVLDEAKLKLLERILVDKAAKLEAKKDKILLDYAVYLETIQECRDIQAKIFAIKEERENLSQLQLNALIAKLQLNENMPSQEEFMNGGMGNE